MKPLLVETPERLEWRFAANGRVLIFLAEAQSKQSTFFKPLKRSAPSAPLRGISAPARFQEFKPPIFWHVVCQVPASNSTFMK